MLVNRKPKQKVEPKRERLDLVNFREAGRILGGLPENTVREKAVAMGLTIVNLNDGLPERVLGKNYLRLIRQEVEAISEKAINTAASNHAYLNQLMKEIGS